MKVKFSRKVLFTPEWNGNKLLPDHERVFVNLKPLTMAELIDLAEVIGELADMRQENVTSADLKRIGSLLKTMTPIFKSNVEIQGLEDENGPVTSEAVLEYQTYMELATEIMAKLSEISSPSEKSEKN